MSGSDINIRVSISECNNVHCNIVAMPINYYLLLIII